MISVKETCKIQAWLEEKEGRTVEVRMAGSNFSLDSITQVNEDGLIGTGDIPFLSSSPVELKAKPVSGEFLIDLDRVECFFKVESPEEEE